MAANDGQLSDLVRRQYGLAAAILCTSARARSTEIDITSQLKSKAYEQLIRAGHDAIASVRSFDPGPAAPDVRASRGRAAEIMCVDHLDLIEKSSFYVTDQSGYRVLRDLKGFTALVNRIFDRLIPSYYRRNFSSEFRNAMGAFAFELISNTHDHARTDVFGKILSKSLRGLYARHYELGIDQLLKSAQGFEPLLSYFTNITANGSTRSKIIELSVYDCGPGLASRWRGVPLDQLLHDEELAAVRECFRPGSTTKNHYSFGGGLPLVLQLLSDHRGFIRIRTGHLSLFWDGAQASDFNLQVWTLPGVQKLSPVLGTVVSVLVPVPEL
ncbi:MAG: hypothetical protein ABJB40_04735 [Acidobacteriota bacterium]